MELDTLAPTDTLLEHAVHVSYQTGLSVYDCVYLALANELHALLITADERLCRAGATVAARISLLR
jgi:predicted nucleic acid-binding protein